MEDNKKNNEETASLEAEIIDNEPGIVLASDILPEEIFIIPVNQRPIFPGIMMPLQVGGSRFLKTFEKMAEQDSRIAGMVFANEYNEEDPLKSELFEIGTAARIIKVSSSGENTAHILVQTIRRFKRVKDKDDEQGLRWQVEYFSDPEGKPDEELKAYTMAVISSVKELLKLNPLFQEQLKMLLANMTHDKPGPLMDLITSMLTADGVKLQEILEEIPLIKRAEKLLKLLQEEIQLFQLQEKIKKSIEEKISKQQKDFFLQEQLKAIKKELGLEKDDKSAEIEKFTKRLEKITVTEEVQKVVDEEMNKMKFLEPVSPEYNVTRTYLDWLTVLPWGVFSEDTLDVKKAKEILEKDHYGLEEIKERILEFISTGIKTGNITGSILCLVGPPGVGKTSIGRSVAEALNRKFFRFSVGGMRDEAEIKGHRRTYIGAMPGKIIQSLKTVGTANPVVMLDEIDKIGMSFRGDPASALLEVLDPEQNHEFLDHYLDVRFDLSNSLFITTANQLDTIPPALLDRMEILKLSGYIMDEKVQIAKKFLIPKTRKAHGLKESELELTDDVLKYIIDHYAREAGVRNLENLLKKIMRKINRRHADGDKSTQNISIEKINEYLGQPVFTEERLYTKERPGVVTGLAWTSMGGATLYVEATEIKNKNGGYKQTGQLGDVMLESSEIAYSNIRANVQAFQIDTEYFDTHFIHLHVPAGATPKDGPSAGITMAMSLYSLATKKAVSLQLAMTGEITLTGKVLPVGGIREKIIAARRIGIKKLILPKENLRDFKELPDYIRAGLKCYFVSYFEDVLKTVYADSDAQPFLSNHSEK